MAEDDMAGEAWKAPYLSYETLTNFFDKKLGGNAVPPRIDPHFLDNYAGSVRPLLLSTLKTIGLIGERNEVLPPLREAARSPEARKQVLRAWAQDFYPGQLALAEQAATASMLWETFAQHRYSGSTLRKAVVFYLALVEDVGLPNSPHFKAPRAQAPLAARNGKARPPRATTPQPAEPVTAPPVVVPSGEEKVIKFGRAGEVTISVSLRWLDLPPETFMKLRQGIDALEALGDPPTLAPPTADASSVNRIEERVS